MINKLHYLQAQTILFLLLCKLVHRNMQIIYDCLMKRGTYEIK